MKGSLWILTAVFTLLAAGRGVTQEENAASSQDDFAKRIAEIEKELDALKELKLTDPSTLRVYWKDGLRMDSADGNVQIKFGGRIQVDSAWFFEDSEIEDSIGDSEDGVEFRRARLYVEGLLYEHFHFRAQYEFAGGREEGTSQGTDFKDVFVGLVNLPHVGNIRAGHYKEPFSLEQLTSGKYTTFMERSLADVFAPGRNVGVMVYNNLFDKRALYQVGLFRDTDNFGDSAADGKYNVTVRFAGSPIYEDDGAKLLHIGGAYSFRNPEGDSVRLRQRPEAHLANRYVDTGNIRTKDVDLFGVEAALVWNQISLQSELMIASFDTFEPQEDPELWGWYIMASYFLTGERRVYRTSYATFDKVNPENSFLDGEGGLGAWELAARYSALDLEEEGIDGGVIHDITGGINWYLTTNFKVMFNYVFSHIEGGGDASIVMVRFQAFW